MCIKKKASQFVPPTLTQVKEFVEEQGLKIKAVMSYCTTGEVASWGEDVDPKPIFMTFRATLEEKSKTQRANIMKRWHGNDTNDTMVRLVSDQESESESEGEGKKRIKRKVEEGKVKGKERKKDE